MTSVSILLVSFLVVAQMIYARDIKDTRTKVLPITTPANMTYDELVYILQTRHGQTRPQPKRLTPCAKAILGCCNGKKMNDICSESLNCGAFFFDDNPCEDKFIIDALEAARLYYEQVNNVA